MNISKEAQHYIDRCFKDGMPVVTKPMFGQSYSFKGTDKLIKFTKEIYREIEESGMVKVKMDGEKIAILEGIHGKLDESP